MPNIEIDISNMSIEQITDEIHQRFLADLYECFKEVFYDLAVKSMHEAVHKDVYAKYRPGGSPNRYASDVLGVRGGYQRRKDSGGLSDPRNFDIRIFQEENGNIIGYVKNETKGVGKAFELDEVIVSGMGYDWTESRIYRMQPFPRDFYQGTIDRIEATNWVYHVRRLMNQRGWHTIGK
jgi:hypothetical protein